MFEIADGNHLLHIPVEGDITFHSIGDMPIERAGLLATEMLGIPVSLMTEHETPYDVLPTVIVYHQGQDGRLPLNYKGAGGLSALGINAEYEGDIVLLFIEGLTA